MTDRPNDVEFLASLPPMVRAAATGNLAEVKFLVAEGSSLSESDDGWTALHAASVRGHPDVVIALLDAGAEVDFVGGMPAVTALWNAAGPTTSRRVIRLLLDAGADPNFADSTYGWTPLSRAVDYDNYDAVELLLAAGADATHTSEDGWTLLMQAAQKGSQAIAKALVDAGADESATCDGKTALDVARSWGNEAVTQLLIDSTST